MERTTLPRVPGRDFSGVVLDGPHDWIGAEVWGTGGDVGFTRDDSHAMSLSTVAVHSSDALRRVFTPREPQETRAFVDV